MRLTDDDLKDCSRAFLESMEAHLVREIDRGVKGLEQRLDLVRAQLPHSPDYTIDHYRRHAR